MPIDQNSASVSVKPIGMRLIFYRLIITAIAASAWSPTSSHAASPDACKTRFKAEFSNDLSLNGKFSVGEGQVQGKKVLAFISKEKPENLSAAEQENGFVAGAGLVDRTYAKAKCKEDFDYVMMVFPKHQSILLPLSELKNLAPFRANTTLWRESIELRAQVVSLDH
jgi:hypothetical protein